MASQTENTDTTYVLDLLCDDDSCSLTTLINDVRFHIIVEPEELRKNSDKTFYYDYLDKISGLREAEQREEEELEIRESQGKTKRARDKDSAVALDDNEEGDDGDQCFGDAVVELRNWILGAFKDIAAVHAPADRTPEESTLHDWYHGPTYFYKLKVSQGCIEPQLLEENKAMTKKIEKLVPRLALPRYIQKMTLPWLNAKDLVVKSETASPEPAHPGEVVTKDGKRLFFKPVDSIQPDSFKREIKHLKQLEELDLDIKVPQLYGLVAFQNSKTEVMGLLLSVIKGATPLTHLFDQSVDPSLRKCWSDKVESYVAQLHEHDIIWGDAKADNFMVDKNDELWIIDFGGSYTEGWVDPELKETIEGDDMGVEKIQNALEDPESNTFDPTNSSTIRPSHARSSSSLFVTEKPRTDSKRKHDGEQNGHDNDTYKKRSLKAS
ncbi:uncharacterized protein CC84DRAFT_1189419 [Paraphaeosphaeria sporulosa]|uniref:Protein kinase domain-containing protein n=1 Tax=Paraphaeosphaeria sporulosa TaxID=1460663 RepID=A0A177C5U4_9PLEO|nr:uncharacterized protein CC84DRAFT_1189419 [Paraphaeosphaeria sporulosa]OAG02097.1 hypothetical protein CC84DRAFT_1189419 [Paraphaeosphaeria sporulosa]